MNSNGDLTYFAHILHDLNEGLKITIKFLVDFYALHYLLKVQII